MFLVLAVGDTFWVYFFFDFGSRKNWQDGTWIWQLRAFPYSIHFTAILKVRFRADTWFQRRMLKRAYKILPDLFHGLYKQVCPGRTISFHPHQHAAIVQYHLCRLISWNMGHTSYHVKLYMFRVFKVIIMTWHINVRYLIRVFKDRHPFVESGGH